jgi:hypothetical protein
VSVRKIDMMYTTMLAELGQRSLDESFATEFPLNGRFVSVPVKGRRYWYFDLPRPNGVKRSYVGTANDVEVSKMIEDFSAIKENLKNRRRLVATLTREGGMNAPSKFMGDVVEAVASTGLFPSRAVLLGAAAFETYSGIVGVRCPKAVVRRTDATLVQFKLNAGLTDKGILEVLENLDPTFGEVPSDGIRSRQFVNSTGFKAEFLLPREGSEDAQTLLIEYLVESPIRTVLLHKSAVTVCVPSPERYAVYKLLVASLGRSDGTDAEECQRDIQQASYLFEALGATRHHADLAIAYCEAWGCGQSWRDGMGRSLSLMAQDRRDELKSVLVKGMKAIGENPTCHGL